MVCWEFLDEMLKWFGFPAKFIYIIMKCVSTIKFTVKINAEGYIYFEGKRGSRQPLLFVLVMEYLTRLFKRMRLPDFHFHPMCKALRLNHLIFADDLMIFCRGDDKSVIRIMEALKHFTAPTQVYS